MTFIPSSSSITVATTVTILDKIDCGSSSSTTLLPANTARISYTVYADKKDLWLKEQADSVDNDKKGIFIKKGTLHESSGTIWKGEISAISKDGTSEVYATERAE